MQRAELDARDVAQPDRRAGRRIGADDDVGEFVGIGKPAGGVDLKFERRSGRRRRLADLAGGDLDVLLGDGALDVDRGHAEVGELVGVEPDAHRIAPLAEDLDVADAGQALQLIDDLQVGVVRQRDLIDRMIGRGQIDDENEVRVLLLDRHAALIDDRRQRRSRLRNAVLDVDGSDIERVADIEGDGDGRRAVVRARRGHVGHALDAVDLLLERRRHGIGDDLRAGAGIVGADDDLRRRDLGELRDRQQEVADRAGEDEDRGDRRGKDRALDEKGHHRTTAPVEIQCRISSKARRRRPRRRARGRRPPARSRRRRRAATRGAASRRSAAPFARFDAGGRYGPPRRRAASSVRLGSTRSACMTAWTSPSASSSSTVGTWLSDMTRPFGFGDVRRSASADPSLCVDFRDQGVLPVSNGRIDTDR